MDSTARDPASLVGRHIRAKRRHRIVGVVGPLVVLIAIGVNVWSIVSHAMALDTDELSKQLEKEGHRAWPDVREHLDQLVESLSPVIDTQIRVQEQQFDQKLSARLEVETKQFEANGAHLFAAAVEKAAAEADVRQDGLIDQHLPELKGDPKARENVKAHVRAAAERWGKRRFATTFDEHVRAMNGIRETLDKGYTGGSGGSGKSGDLVLLWLELFNESVADDSTILDPPDAATEGAP